MKVDCYVAKRKVMKAEFENFVFSANNRSRRKNFSNPAYIRCVFHGANRENEASCQGKRLRERLSFTSFCASGNDLFFRRGNERDENAVKRR